MAQIMLALAFCMLPVSQRIRPFRICIIMANLNLKKFKLLVS